MWNNCFIVTLAVLVVVVVVVVVVMAFTLVANCLKSPHYGLSYNNNIIIYTLL